MTTDHEQRLTAGRACLEAALQVYLPQGFSVTCCCDPDHVGVFAEHGKTCTSPGKAPMHPWKELQAQLLTHPQVERQWGRYPIGNVGCVLGQASGLVRVDVDGDLGEAALQECSHGDLPDTWEFRSSAKGRGLLYRWPKDQPCQTVVKPSPDGGHVELRLQGDGSQTVLPPSRHVSGSIYTWTQGHSPDDLPLAPAPAWLVAQMAVVPRPEQPAQTPTSAPSETYAAELLRWVPNPGADRDTWLDMGMALHSTGADWAFDLWDAWSQQYPEKYDASDQAKAWNSFSLDGPAGKAPITFGTLVHLARQHGYQRRNGSGPDNDAPLPYSDYTNALAFVRDHGQDLRYCYPWGKWLVWTGTHWQRDTSGAVMRLAKRTVKRLARQVEDLDDAHAKALMAHIKASLSTARLKALVENAQSEPRIPVQPEDLDTDPWLLNVANGTLDLRTGELHPHARADTLTFVLPVAYDQAATAPIWTSFLERIMAGNTNLISFLQRAIGYALTGVIREHVLLILWGRGRNGKSTFLNILRTLLGPYAMKAPSELLMVSNNDRHPTERADLWGKRFVSAIETEQGRRLAEVFVKEATGGDPIRARRMREDFWEFQPTHKVFLATNHKPVITGTDNAIWERIRLVPFTVTIPPEERDTILPEKLEHELPGILAWAVQGCLAWQRDGLGEPDEVKHATAGYRTDMDVLGQFIEECCVVGPNYRTKAAVLYDAYKAWCDQQGIAYAVQRTWGMQLTDRGFERFTNNGAWYRNIGIVERQHTSTEGTEGTEGENRINRLVNSTRGQTRKVPSVPSVPSVEPDDDLGEVEDADEGRPKNGIGGGDNSGNSSVPPPCFACRGTVYWTNAAGMLICARCHPQPSPERSA